VTFHAALGVRVILLDFNLVSIKYRTTLVWGLLACGLAIMVCVWRSIY
jgi:succinate dehydrogenase/fumarate reductase cytochrome b subunit